MASFQGTYKGPDHQLVRDYVTALDHLQYQNLAEGVVSVHITHINLPSKYLDLRFDLHMTVISCILKSAKKIFKLIYI
jgi:hypothetical protein